ncbi:MAG: cytochrome c3 family protein [Fidelibacterota bacterium]
MKIGSMMVRGSINIINHIFILSIMGLMIAGCSKKPIKQPIAYNHSIHVNDAGLDCTDCHSGAVNKIRATLPSIKKCKSCHSEMQGESIAETLVVKAVNNKEEIPWQRIYQLKDHVFFSHRRHVTAGNLSCELCHGNVEEMVVPPKQPLIPISMDNCIKCHDSKSISTDCLNCHV